LNSSPRGQSEKIMATKTTTVNSTLTPSGDLAFANAALGAVPAPPQDRFSAGSLASSVLSASDDPMLLIVGASILISADQSIAGNEGNGVAISLADNLDVDIIPLEFEVGSVSGKSGLLTIVGEEISITSTVTADGDPVTEPVRLALLQPVRSSFSLLSLINKVESVCNAEGKGFIVLLNQDTEELTVYLYPTPAAAAAALAAARTAFTSTGGTIKAAFDMIVPSTSPSAIKYAFE
jgi:hypothetical protein